MRSTAAVAIASFIVVVALAGCVRTNIAPPPAAVAPPAVAAPPAIESAAPPAAALEPSPVAAPPVAPAPPTVASRPPAVAATPAPAPAASAAAKTVSKAPAPPKIVAAPPTLDLASLETRLRATGAIGVFTKLSLKNQVSDLLDQFKTFHHSGAPPLTVLRQEYDLLLLKVLSLLQDNDPSLASAVSASRESIWGMLADPAKFAKLG